MTEGERDRRTVACNERNYGMNAVLKKANHNICRKSWQRIWRKFIEGRAQCIGHYLFIE